MSSTSRGMSEAQSKLPSIATGMTLYMRGEEYGEHDTQGICIASVFG